MTKTATVTVRLDPKVKDAAQAVFDQLGLTTTQAIYKKGYRSSCAFRMPRPHKPSKMA
jgi:hypothetical protein